MSAKDTKHIIAKLEILGDLTKSNTIKQLSKIMVEYIQMQEKEIMGFKHVK